MLLQQEGYFEFPLKVIYHLCAPDRWGQIYIGAVIEKYKQKVITNSLVKSWLCLANDPQIRTNAYALAKII